jgi:hypothetical protein
MVHGVIGLGIVLLAPWKTTIVRRGLGKKKAGKPLSLALLVLVLVTLGTGLLHSFGVSRLGPLTMMQVHVGGAVLALALAADHFRRHPVRPRRFDVDRRAFIRTTTLAVTTAAFWFAWEGVVRALEAPGRDRRFTGSHQRGSRDPDALPTTSWLDDRPPEVDPLSWEIEVGEQTLGPGDLEAMPHETLNAVLDCTGGWYSEQAWTGIRLDKLLEPGGGRSFVVWSSTGYARRFPVRDLSSTWLVTRLGGEPLSRGHGFPARIVAPARRGFWWVKWVKRIELSPVPWWVQSPFPLT